jgi:hypothetical protein
MNYLPCIEKAYENRTNLPFCIPKVFIFQDRCILV